MPNVSLANPDAATLAYFWDAPGLPPNASDTAFAEANYAYVVAAGSYVEFCSMLDQLVADFGPPTRVRVSSQWRGRLDRNHR